MDINTALANARQALADLDDPDYVVTSLDNPAEALADAFRAIDQWLTRGGFLPTEWDRGTPDPTEEEEGPRVLRCRDCEHPLHQMGEKALSGEVAVVWADQHDVWVCDETGNEHRPGVTS